MSKAMVPIDPHKLRALLKQYNKANDTINADLGRYIGHAESYFHNVLKRGTIDPEAVAEIEAQFGIKPDDYVVNPGVAGGD